MESARQSAVPLPPKVGRYDVLLPIASGGMATVYLARSRGAGGFEREVALKLTHAHLAESPEFSRELIEEGKLAVAIRHANVVAVLDVGEDASGLFLVMEYIEGDSLAGLMRRAGAVASGSSSPPLDPRIFLRVLLDALAGLHAAHELADPDGHPLGLVHRDFSPQNILVGTDGVARLTDFGIAKAASRIGLTSTGVVKGKINYMAPEQVRGDPVDRRADVWAAGVLAWELFAGRRLHGRDEIGTIFRIASVTPPLLRSVNPNVHPAMEAAVARALTPDLEGRTPTASAFAKDLGAALREASIDLAEPSDVAAVVKQLAGPKLAERRTRAREVIELRRELSDFVRTTSDALTPPTGHAAPRLPAAEPRVEPHPPASDPAAQAGSQANPRLQAGSQASPGPRAPAEPVTVAAAVEQPTTDTSSVSVSTERMFRRRPAALMAAAGAGAVALVLVLSIAISPGAPAVTAQVRAGSQETPEASKPPAAAEAPLAAAAPSSSSSAASTATAAPSAALPRVRNGLARPRSGAPAAPRKSASPSFLDIQH